jgi:hypothetical protein
MLTHDYHAADATFTQCQLTCEYVNSFHTSHCSCLLPVHMVRTVAVTMLTSESNIEFQLLN